MEQQPKNPARMAILKAQMEREAKPPASVVASVSGHPTSRVRRARCRSRGRFPRQVAPPATEPSALEKIASVKALLKQEPEGSK